MNVLFCAYRDWAQKVYYDIRHANFNGVVNCDRIDLVKTHDDMLLNLAQRKYDIVILVGWSWKVPADTVNSTLVVGMHPSPLPAYAGGSPIQNQILDGIQESVATLFRLNEKFDDGEIIKTEPFSLKGHLSDVFWSLQNSSFELIKTFLQEHPNHTFIKQDKSIGHVVKRLKPEQSELSDISSMTTMELYNFIRCREDPYPNAFIKDEHGTLLIKSVEFIPS